MQLIKLVHADVYRHAEKWSQCAEHPWILFSIRGLVSKKLYDPAGNLFSEYNASGNVPFMELLAPDFRIVFEFDSTRENWVAMFKWDSFRYDCASRKFLLRIDETELEIPQHIELNEMKMEKIRQEFRQIRELFFSAVPENLLAADIMLQNLFLMFMRKSGRADDPVDRFRKMLDEDPLCRIPLSIHCRAAGYSQEQMRVKFMEHYGITPREYRVRRRLIKILGLFNSTDLNLKEIAYKAGLKNVTHLNALIRKHYGKTPKELRKNIRF